MKPRPQWDGGLIAALLSLLPRRWLQSALAHQWRASLSRREALAYNHFGATGNKSHHPFAWADDLQSQVATRSLPTGASENAMSRSVALPQGYIAEEIVESCGRNFTVYAPQRRGVAGTLNKEAVDTWLQRASDTRRPGHATYTLQSGNGGTFLLVGDGQIFISADHDTVQRYLTMIGVPLAKDGNNTDWDSQEMRDD